MAVEEIRGNNGYHNGNYDNFPAGMRVLAVDDDPTCLRLLEALLRKCQYRVTVKSRAREALQILRENRDRFDLVISDVHMPDMDGFKLLELVGLEMDLPVIKNGDPKLVMKGVTHGACDYLLKPIRMEELRNIWQHVIRRKGFDYTKMSKSTGQTNTHQASGQGKLSLLTGNVDQNGILNRKRKDDVDEHEVNGDGNEDPATHKKPRVVWSIELHRKFVAAVNQLGIEKALPKRILDMMNVEGLTRENVASHLQKYRIYLKRISSVATQQANMAAALVIEASTFVCLGTLDGFDDIRTLAGSRSFPNTASSPYSVNGMLGRLNSPSDINLDNLTSSALVHPNHLQISSDSMTNVGKFHPVISPGSQNASLFPESLDASRMFTADSSFMDTGEAIGSSSNSLNGAHNNSLISTVPLFKMQLPEFQLNSLTSTESLHGQLPLNIVRDNNSSDDPCLQSNPLALTSTTMDAQLFEDSRGEMQFQEGLVNEWRRSSSGNYLSEQANLQGCFVSQSYSTLDDLVNAVVKLEQDENLPDGNFGFDDYSFGQGL